VADSFLSMAKPNKLRINCRLCYSISSCI